MSGMISSESHDILGVKGHMISHVGPFTWSRDNLAVLEVTCNVPQSHNSGKHSSSQYPLFRVIAPATILMAGGLGLLGYQR